MYQVSSIKYLKKRRVFLIGLLVIGFWLLAAPVLAVVCKSGEAVDPNTGSCISVAITQNLNCFSQDECEAPPYQGHVSGCREPKQAGCAKPVSECQKEADGRNFYCYAPRITICQPGSKETNCAVNLEVAIGGKTIQGLEGYIAALYKWLVAISGILAGLMITYAGVKWMLASGNPEKINEAKHKVGDAIVGLILVVGSYVIMQTINPALVSLQMPPVKIARQLGISTQGKCALVGIPQSKLTKDPELKKELACGQEKFDCSKLPEACGGVAAGTCVPVMCEKGGCYDVDTNKAVSIMGSSRQLAGRLRTVLGEVAKSKQICVDKTTDCNCSAINKRMNENKGNFMYNYQAVKQCLANICDCVLFEYTSEDSSRAVVECQEKWKDGDECVYGGDPVDVICLSGLCNSKTRKCTRGDPVGTDCNRDKECQSGICHSTIDACAPIGGGPEGGQCGVDRDCQPDLACNTGMGGTCQKRQGKGEFCGKGGDCQSGQCSGVLKGVGSLVNIRRCE